MSAPFLYSPGLPSCSLVPRYPRERADERTAFHPRDIARIGAGIVTPGPWFLVELDERAARDHPGIEAVAFQ